MLVELLRLLTYCSTLELLSEEGSIFYHHLCSRRYPLSFLRTVFQEVTWSWKSQLLAQSNQRKYNKFEDLQGRCPPLSVALKRAALKKLLDQTPPF